MPGDTAPFDVAVIGAGINGAGIARDAALRGLRVVVFDKNDMCSGTSAVSSRLIHGGLRYLEHGEIPLVFESLRERITLRRIAVHLVKPIRICIPVYESAKRGPLLIRLGMIAYDLLSIGKTVPRHDMLTRRKLIDGEPEAHGMEPPEPWSQLRSEPRQAQAASHPREAHRPAQPEASPEHGQESPD